MVVNGGPKAIFNISNSLARKCLFAYEKATPTNLNMTFLCY